MVPQAPVWLWLFFAAVTGAAFLLDLLIHWRPMTVGRAIARSLAWIGLGLAFAFVVADALGKTAAQEYVAAFFIEKALSLDNLAAFFLIFRELEIPATMQHRVLAAGILGAIVARALFIAAGVEVLGRWHPVVYLLAVILLVACGRSLAMKESGPDHRPVLTFVRRHLRLADATSGHFFVRIGNRWRPTTLIVGVVAIETADVVFAMDSIPSALAVTSNPFVLYTSNLLAVLGLRALYIVLAAGAAKMPYLRYGIAFLLFLASFKLITSVWITIPPAMTATIVVACVVLMVVLGIAFRAKAGGPSCDRTTPHGRPRG